MIIVAAKWGVSRLEGDRNAPICPVDEIFGTHSDDLSYQESRGVLKYVGPIPAIAIGQWELETASDEYLTEITAHANVLIFPSKDVPIDPKAELPKDTFSAKLQTWGIETKLIDKYASADHDWDDLKVAYAAIVDESAAIAASVDVAIIE